ncbi:ribosome biogenesis protein BOP1 homolog [Ischnura elegans]|uniref:ribosome biogenesis protein BOP1 homolog n=1 Tax=Ischnura elegans TaxID=197161 RepID=UPI001ED87B98|nr:ribosome biogenesis protein BOP1 homolog [Ischnura elegans]
MSLKQKLRKRKAPEVLAGKEIVSKNDDANEAKEKSLLVNINGEEDDSSDEDYSSIEGDSSSDEEKADLDEESDSANFEESSGEDEASESGEESEGETGSDEVDVSDASTVESSEEVSGVTSPKVDSQSSSNAVPSKNKQDKPVTRRKKNVSTTKEESTTDGNSEEASSSQRNSGTNEYESDTSDEEDMRNTVGKIPMKWYDEFTHLGYDWDGKKILRPKRGDELDNFLRKMEDPDFWRTVKDSQTGQDIVLGENDLEIIERIQKGKIPDSAFDDHAPWVEWFSSIVMKTPIRKFPEHKRSFLPSKTEKEQVSRMVHAIKMGWMKTKEQEEEELEKRRSQGPKFFMLWGAADDEAEEYTRRIHAHIPAPKRQLPGHAESYNPPPEYLFDERETKQWLKLKETPWKRKLHFMPKKYNSLREVPAYDRYTKERFLRCLDLYLCPRGRKMRLTIEPEDLVPQLPDPKDLQPFPTTLSMIYRGHTDMVRTIAVDPKGQYLASGSDDETLKVWEISTGRCVKTFELGYGVVRRICWCPNTSLSLIAIAAGKTVLLLNPGVGEEAVVERTDELLSTPPAEDLDTIVPERVKTAVQWEHAGESAWDKGIRVLVHHFKDVHQVSWHGRGDYFVTVMPEGQNRSVVIHQLSKRRSQLPFAKPKGLVQCVLFHPIRPFLFVATQRNIRVYDLVKQELVKKLLSNSRWISSMAIHPGGDNVLVGTYDRKALWFDLDLSTTPYQTLRLHGTAIRSVAFHKRYPLFASGSDDRALIVSHGMVYNDLLQNPLIVPLKRLCDHEAYDDFGIFDVQFHPAQPWVFSAGADSTIRLYS